MTDEEAVWTIYCASKAELLLLVCADAGAAFSDAVAADATDAVGA